MAEIPYEMESKLYVSYAKQAQKIIKDMPTEKFEEFQRELQYALKYWATAYNLASIHIRDNIIEGREGLTKDEAYDAYLYGRERAGTIDRSILYDFVRTRMRNNYPDAEFLSSDWTGWLGLASQQDMDNINQAIDVIWRAELPISGLIGGEVSDERLTEAKETVEKYGIQGVFVENPTVLGLVTTFHQHLGTNPNS